MPGKSGFDGLMQIKCTFPRLPVVIISSLKDEDVVNHARVLGASGFILKSTRRQDIIASLITVLEGGTCFANQFAGKTPGRNDMASSEQQEFNVPHP